MAVADLPEERQTAELDRLCAGDEELRARVAQLLSADRAPAVVDRPVSAEHVRIAISASPAPGAPAPLPTHIGSYEIVGLLGQGGMGTVYRARQAHPARDVALKVINPALLTHSLTSRFEFEAQVLAQLHHPGIAEIYEAGTAEIGGTRVPFLAMELVEGKALTADASARALTTRQRLELMRSLCEAVHHAHQRGVIHRDLKPGNILVDAEGRPKILDFGVARMTTSQQQYMTLQTQPGQLVGTLPYMSPEQLSGDPKAVDIRSDIYALGVITYELLAGRLPHELNERSLSESVRVLERENAPMLGSMKAEYRGDIEVIVAKAMDKNPARRYGSAAELGREIERHLTGEAIEARRDSRMYILKKAVVRHRAPVSVAAGFMLLLMIATAAALVFALGEARQRRLAERTALFQRDMLRGLDTAAMGAFLRERLRAQAKEAISREYVRTWPERRLRTADEVEAALAVFDEVATPGPAADAARAMMDEFVLSPAARTLEDGFADEPALRAPLSMALGEIYEDIGMLESAEVQLRAAADLRKTSLPTDDAAQAEISWALGRVVHARGRYAEAEALYREALRLHKTNVPVADVRTGQILGSLASCLKDLGRLEESGEMFSDCIALLRREAPESDSLARALASDGERRTALGDLRGAEEALQEALSIHRRKNSKGDHPTAVTLNNLSHALLRAGRFGDALPFQKEAVDLFIAINGHDHPQTLHALHNLADLQREMDLLDEAETTLKAVIDTERRMGMHAESIATSMTVLALIYQERGDLAGAEPLLRQAVDSFRTLGERHPDYAKSLNNLASTLHLQGKVAEAEPLYRQALEIRLSTPGSEHVEVATMLNNLAAILRDSGRFEEADEYYVRAVDMFRRVAPEHPAIGSSLAGRARVNDSLRRYEVAEDLFGEALDVFKGALPAGHEQIWLTKARLGRTQTRMGKFAEARAALEEAAAGLELTLDGEAPAPTASRVFAAEALAELFETWNAVEEDPERARLGAAWRSRLADLTELGK